MLIEITIGIIGSLLASIIGGIGVYSYKKANEVITKPPKDWRSIITGTWQGHYRTQIKGVYMEVPGIITLKTKHKQIIGKIEMLGLKNDFIEIPPHSSNVFGAFIHNRYIRLQYENELEHVVQFGAAVLELNSFRNKMTGRLVGYGPTTENILYGSVDLTKK